MPRTIRANLLHVGLLRREKRMPFEERDHPVDELFAIPHDEHERAIRSAVRLDVATTEPSLDQLQDLSSVTVLADMELGNELRPETTRSIALHRDREAAFSVDIPCDVAIQPFLLIVRTRHVVTIVNA
jgi:hypothetical protein